MNIMDVREQLIKHPTKEYSTRDLDAIEFIAIHHSATQGGDAFSFARYHVNSHDWPGIGYHYVILSDGTVQWTNNLSTISYHVREYNTKAVGICLVGNFVDGQLNEPQRKSLNQLCSNLLNQLDLTADDVKGHNEFLPGYTQCPALDMNQIRAGLAAAKEGKIQIYVDDSKIEV